MNIESIKNNKTGMILQFSVPSIIAMLLTSLITLTDGFFVGNYVGKEGLAAINLGLPIVYLFLAVGLLVSVGGSAIATMALGASDTKKGVSVFNQTMLTSLAATVVVSLVLYATFEPLTSFLQAKDLVAVYFRQYYKIILIELPLMVFTSSAGMFIRGEGNPQFFMKTSICSVLLNILLDYVFSVWCGWGIRGVAWASLISASVSVSMVLHFFVRKSHVYKLARFEFSSEVLKNTILNGSSEFIGELSMCIAMFAYNWIIMRKIGVDGLTAFTIIGYSSYVFSMIVVGFGQGASPLISFAYGAKELKTAASLRKRTNVFVLGCGVVMTTFMMLFSTPYSSIFIKDEAIHAMVRTGIFIFTPSFLLSGCNTIISFYFTSIGKALPSAVISSSRGLVVLLACIFTLPVLFGMNGVWLVTPVTEAVTIVMSALFVASDAKRIRNAMHTTNADKKTETLQTA